MSRFAYCTLVLVGLTLGLIIWDGGDSIWSDLAVSSLEHELKGNFSSANLLGSADDEIVLFFISKDELTEWNRRCHSRKANRTLDSRGGGSLGYTIVSEPSSERNTWLNVEGMEKVDVERLKSPFAMKGIDFVDSYRKIPWDITKGSMTFDFRHSLGVVEPPYCSINDGKQLVLFRVVGWGTGSDFVNRANYLLWASFDPSLHLLYVKSSSMWHAEGWFPYATFLESNFLMAEVNASCTDVLFAPKDWNNRFSHWEDMSSWIEEMQRSPSLEQVIGLKSLLLRQIMRMKPLSRRRLDVRHRAALDGVVCGEPGADPNAISISIHIRRTDKSVEAIPVSTARYLEVVMLLRSKLRLDARRNLLTLHIMSDEPHVRREVTDFINANPVVIGPVQVNFRIAIHRPDMRERENNVNEAFWRLLVDLRLMVTSDYFIGTQSSNVGVVACMLRGHQGCFSVESDPPDFKWDGLKDKPRR